MSDRIRMINTKTKEEVMIIDSKRKKITYKISKESSQHKYTKKFILKGFTEVPPGFRKSGDYAGFGLTGQGYRILALLYDSLDKKYDVIISKEVTQTEIKELATKYNVTFKYSDLRTILNHLNLISRDKAKELKLTAQSYLHKFFSVHVSKPATEIKHIGNYQKGELAKVLRKDGIHGKLTKEDKDTLKEFYPAFLNLHTENLATKTKLLSLADSKNKTQVVYLENIIEEFKKKRVANPSETKWQEFLKQYILLFNLNYTDIIEKTNISVVKDKMPDFMLIDAYNFLDIFEIKKPSTPLMRFDDKRSNFYWSQELSKAIAQTEAYIYYVTKNAPTIRDDLKAYKDLDVRVVKPRGYVIAGETAQLRKKYYKGKVQEQILNKLTNIQIQNGFRLLNEYLRNVTIVFYDELINSLETFLKRIKKE
jgi:hypothetical protein